MLLLPIAGVIALLFLRQPAACRWVALGVSLGTFLFALSLLISFNWHRGTIYGYAVDGGSMQLVQEVKGFSRLHLQYKVGVDGLSVPLIFLVTFMMPMVVMASWRMQERPRRYLGLLLLLESCLLGSLVSLDLVQLYLFFEVSLAPVYMLVSMSGRPGRRPAVIKTILYSLVGSGALLIGMVGIYLHSWQMIPAGTFDVIRLASPKFAATLWGPMARRFFGLLMLGFATRMAALPVHAWLLDLQMDIPAPVNMLIAASMPMLGGYGILRVVYPIFPHVAETLWLTVAIVGGVGMIYASLCALGQTDFKRLATYCSISQMGMVLLGVSMMTPAGVNGALFLIITNGFTSALLFYILGVMQDRFGHHKIDQLGGIAGGMPVFTGFSSAAVFASLGLPGMCGFVGQVLVLIGMFQSTRPESPLYRHAFVMGDLASYLLILRIFAIALCANMVVMAGSMIRALSRTYFGPKAPPPNPPVDVKLGELAVLLPLTIMIILLGITPAFFVFTLSNSTLAGILRLF